MITAHLHPTKFQTVVSNGKTAIVVDTEKDGQGGATGLRPPDLMEAALAACVNLTIRISAEKFGIPLSYLKTTVNLDTAPSENTVMQLNVDFGDGITEDQRLQLLGTIRLCPVSRLLSRPILIQGK